MQFNIEQQHIIASLAPLFRQAERERKWFYCKYTGEYYAPEELRSYQQQGQFIWGCVNWELRAPEKYLKELLQDISYYEQRIKDFNLRYKRWMGEENETR